MKKTLILPALLLIIPLGLWLTSEEDSRAPEKTGLSSEKNSTQEIEPENSKSINNTDKFSANPGVIITSETSTNAASPKANNGSNGEGAAGELPEDLRRQLESPPPELPDDLKAQLSNPNPEIPEDIRRAMEVPPRKVSIDEVNNPQLPVE